MSSKYTAFHVPRAMGILDKAKKLAEMLQEGSAIAGISVPMYAAIDLALNEAIEARTAPADQEVD